MATSIKARVIRQYPLPKKDITGYVRGKQDKHLIPNIKDIIAKLYSSVDKIASDALKFYAKHELGNLPLQCDGIGQLACADLPDALEKCGFSCQQKAAAIKGLNKEIKQKGLTEGLGFYHTTLARLKEFGDNLLDQLAFGKSVADAQAKKDPKQVLEKSAEQKAGPSSQPWHNPTLMVRNFRSAKNQGATQVAANTNVVLGDTKIHNLSIVVGTTCGKECGTAAKEVEARGAIINVA